jgi:hypothetical protein
MTKNNSPTVVILDAEAAIRNLEISGSMRSPSSGRPIGRTVGIAPE